MAVTRQRNSFDVLQLDARASLPEVIQRSRQLCNECIDRHAQATYRRAAEEIRQHPVARAYAQFWQPPATGYDDFPDLSVPLGCSADKPALRTPTLPLEAWELFT